MEIGGVPVGGAERFECAQGDCPVFLLDVNHLVQRNIAGVYGRAADV